MFKRLFGFIRGFFGLFIGGFESSHPEVLFEDITNQINKAKREAEESIIGIQTNAELIKIEMKSAEKELATITSRITSAKNTGNKDLLVEVLIQAEEVQSRYDTCKETYDNAVKETAKIRDDYKLFESEMSQKLNEVRTLNSQAKMATLREGINSINATYSSKNSRVGSINEQMSRVRDVVNKKTARANAVESLNDTNTELKIRKLDMSATRENAIAKAEKMLTVNYAETATKAINADSRNVIE